MPKPTILLRLRTAMLRSTSRAIGRLLIWAITPAINAAMRNAAPETGRRGADDTQARVIDGEARRLD